MILANPKRFVVQEINKIIGTGFFFWEKKYALLLRLGMVVGMLVLAPALGLLVVKVKPSFMVLGVAAVPLVLFILQFMLPRFDLAPLIILFFAAFMPIKIPTGTESTLVDSLLLTLLFGGNWLLKMLIVDKHLRLQPSPANKPLLGFMVMTLFSLVWGIAFRDPLVDPSIISNHFALVQTASTVTNITLGIAFLLVTNHINDVRLLKSMVAIMLVAGVVGVAGRFGLSGQAVLNDGGLFSMWVVSLSTGLAFFNRQLSWRRRALLLLLAGSWIYWGFGLHISWLAGWLPAFVAVGVLIFMRSKKLLLITLLLAVILVSFKSAYIVQKLQAEDGESGGTRIQAWAINWQVTGKHLIFGTGPAGYGAYYMTYFPTEAMATHSTYIDLLAQTGIIGFGLCMWFFATLIWMGYKLCIRLKGRGDFVEGTANAVLAGTVGAIAAMGIGDWIFPFAYTQTIAGYDYVVYSWLFMGAIVVLDRLYPAPIAKIPEISRGAL
ncbi:MAG: hypothetical protein KJ077_09530 [Anaerolineae bacterium]|nr:hypothetical protein [Anaerolineae bacterium]